ncbi:GPO family capsid scaffolding protein [Pseudomonas sp. zfem003]|uniref:GPO family capsid scaffolding protein n=1 Tax=Pseudomonas sp. zfem003 TaxID=3078198 RepID=UPI00292776ED|nr:GPO family capsid scaffolding protein [Pseudomonas sp. zfem003]MDU9395390.1 GPO family capsid scaffolding protein [Pseudomonas sp. zfem003]
MKKFRSKWLRVAVEGATTDKRVIKRSWLEQAAKNFSQNTYGARIWLEHFRSLLPDGPFKAYGDVVALKTEEVEISGQKKLALYAQLEPTSELLALNKAKQKIYTSIELDENFADSGEAYMVGLAVTDSPASLGTDVLTFSAQKPEASPFSGRHYSETSMFSEAIEADLEFEEVTDQVGLFGSLKTAISDLISKGKDKEGRDATSFKELGEALEGLVTFATQQQEHAVKADTAIANLTKAVETITTDFAALKEQLGKTQDLSQKQRPPVTGDKQRVVTDC